MATASAIFAGLAGYAISLAAFLAFRWANQHWVEAGDVKVEHEEQAPRLAA